MLSLVWSSILGKDSIGGNPLGLGMSGEDGRFEGINTVRNQE